MMVQVGEFLQTCAMLLGCAVTCGMVGFIVPLFFDRDVGGALAADLLATSGLIVGVVIGAVIIRRRFD